ncbi:unnamed protein product [Sphagnum jensenii]|uniref:Uncharacterized protein n=1 Tax=Sphagnum jensenii TaxID=128206 RepID=A0ABP0VJY4_9BRYO
MNNDTGGAVAAQNLLLKRDPSSTEHLVHKQKMASILASPQAARKKRFVKLELGSLEASPPAGANPFQDPKAEGDTTQHDSAQGRGYVEYEGIESPSILTAYPPWCRTEAYLHPIQNRIKATIRDRSAGRPP